VGNLHTNFGVSGTFCSGLTGQHLSDAPRDLGTLTFITLDVMMLRHCASFYNASTKMEVEVIIKQSIIVVNNSKNDDSSTTKWKKDLNCIQLVLAVTIMSMM